MLDTFDQPTDSTAYGCRSWLYLLLNFGLGMTYFGLLMAGYALGFGLSFIWIGLPLLALMFSLTRRTANFDRWLASKFIGIQLAQIPDDLNVRNANPVHLVGAHLTSATTWQSAVYLLMKLPLGMTSLMMAMLIAPFFFFELLLTLVGINTGMITGRIIRAMAAGLSGALGGLSPAVEPAPGRERGARYVSVPAREVNHDDLWESEPETRQEKAKRRLQTTDGEIEEERFFGREANRTDTPKRKR
jgi:hypothetical protein